MDLKSFIIGSSFPVFILFFLAVRQMDQKIRNFTYQDYTLIAPLYLGLMNILGGVLFQGTNRYLYTGLLSGSIVAMIATLLKTYKYSRERWLQYYFHIIFKHVVIYTIIVQSLSQLLE